MALKFVQAGSKPSNSAESSAICSSVIAAGAGVQVQDVNRLIKQFEDTRRLMKELTGSKNGKRLQKRLGKNFR